MQYFKSWIIYFVLSLVLCAVAGGIVGFILGAIMGGAGFSIQQIQVICGIAGFIAGIPVSFLLFRWAVSLFFVPKTDS